MTQAELDQIKARAAAATPGPWEYTTDNDADDYRFWEWPQDIISKGQSFERFPNMYPGQQFPVTIASMAETEGVPLKDGFANAAFIAHARADVPALVAEVEQLQNLVREMAVALETCDSLNRSKLNFGEESRFQQIINDLLIRADWRKATEAAK